MANDNGAVKEQERGLAVIKPMPLAGGLAPRTLEEAMEVSKTLAKSGLLPGPLRDKPADVLVVMLKGLELGLKPMHALSEIYVVDGRPGCSAALKRALILQHPSCEYFRCVESTDKKATYVSKRRGGVETKTTYTIEQALNAGLTGKANWKNHPAAMLRARSSGAEADANWSDVCQGLTTLDELKEIEGRVVDMKPNRVTNLNTVAPPPPPTPPSSIPDEPITEDEFDKAARELEQPEETPQESTPEQSKGEPSEADKMHARIDEAQDKEQLSLLNKPVSEWKNASEKEALKQHWIRRASEFKRGAAK